MSLEKAKGLVARLWSEVLQLPESSLDALSLQDPSTPVFPSSFDIDTLASASIALVSLSAAQYRSVLTNSALPHVSVYQPQASLAFKCECLYTVNGAQPKFPGYFGGLLKCSDGVVRIHDAFKIHRKKVMDVLGLPPESESEKVLEAVRCWNASDLEEAVTNAGAVAARLRNYGEWDASIGQWNIQWPIQLKQLERHDEIGDPWRVPVISTAKRCLDGIKVVELSRVVAAPVAGRALAAHGADVVWVIGPPEKTEDIPVLDTEFTRAKRKVVLDLDDLQDVNKLKRLIIDADVFIQSYRPGSLERKGFGVEDVRRINPTCIYATLSAWGWESRWKSRRGFDSIVQTASGMNASEAAYFDPTSHSKAKPMPCQALDHGSGYFLAAGILAALCHRIQTHRGYLVQVSLAGTACVLRGLGQSEITSEASLEQPIQNQEDVIKKYGEESAAWFTKADTEEGEICFFKYPSEIEGFDVG